MKSFLKGFKEMFSEVFSQKDLEAAGAVFGLFTIVIGLFVGFIGTMYGIILISTWGR